MGHSLMPPTNARAYSTYAIACYHDWYQGHRGTEVRDLFHSRHEDKHRRGAVLARVFAVQDKVPCERDDEAVVEALKALNRASSLRAALAKLCRSG